MSALRNAIPTRPGPLQRLRMAVRAAYLRILIHACEQDIEWHKETARLAPQREAIARQRRDELAVELAGCEVSGRSR
jgi:hypothetical protein